METAQANSQEIQEIINELVGAAHGDFVKVTELLDAHPELVNASASWVETPVEAGAQMGRVDIVEYLLDRGAPLDICTAAMLGRADTVREILQADPSLGHATGAHGIPSLYFPSITNHPDIAEMLLDHGADINAGAGGNTPLHGAAMFGQEDMVRWLLEHGANKSALDYAGKTPYQVALDRGDQELAGLFA